MPQTHPTVTEHAELVTEIQLKASALAADAAGGTEAQRGELEAMISKAEKLKASINLMDRAHALSEVAEDRAEMQDAQTWAFNRLNKNSPVQMSAAGEVVEEDQPQMSLDDKLRNLGKFALGQADASSKPVPHPGSVKIQLVPAAMQLKLIEAGVTPLQVALAAQTKGQMLGIDKWGRLEATIDTGTGNSTPKGGNLIPSLFAASFYDYMQFLGGLRAAGAYRSSSDSGATMSFYRMGKHYDASAGGETAESAAVTLTEDAYDRYSVPVYAYTGSAVITKEALQDISVDIESLINEGISRTIGWKTENRFHSGSGSSQPTGLLASSAVSAVTSSTTAAAGDPKITTDNIIDLMFGIDAYYIMNPAATVFLLRPDGYGAILKLKDTQNRPMFQAARYVGEPDTIQGRRVVYDAFIPEVKASTASVFAVFGSVRDAYHIRDAQEIEITASAHVKFQNRQIVYLGDARSGGNIRDHRAVRFFKTKG